MKSDIISIAMGELQVAFDNEVMKAVRKVGVDVNKEELLKALELHHNLVHCQDCKYASDDGTYGCMCEHFNDTSDAYHRMWSDDFCSRGERNSSEKPNKSEIPTDSERVGKYPYNCNWDE